ncbi:N-6 DNA methylase [uncultured Campylobacter sp.]|uniref:N-6 DNA methylase n=1 Tax=uncultured Campylobacter sp. TaxID=218934 RepID=UPI0026180128|nr:N-6 DNA methylase [uncultured Campylobacter sp.]
MNKIEKIQDYITGIEIKDTPEEREAVQPFLKILHQDYEYPKEMLQSHPQYRVKSHPSDKKGFPIDIAVFENIKGKKQLKIVVECKKKDRKDGLEQLKTYLKFCEAKIGIWFNGDELVCIKKNEQSGNITFDEIPSFPKYNEKLEEIGLYKRKDLRPTHNLKDIFRQVRGYIVANSSGVNRDEMIAKEMIHLILCKIYDERFTAENDMVTFRASIIDEKDEVKVRITTLFNEVKEKYKDVLTSSDEIEFDGNTLKYIIGLMQNICIIDTDRDTIADAFEVFIGYSLKGSQGQFFTPKNIVKLMVEIVNPQRNQIVIDPSCGSCGFLVESLKHIWRQIELTIKNPKSQWEEQKEVGIKNIRGIEKDSFLTKVGKSYMAILGDGKGGIFCEDSLEIPTEWNIVTQQHIHLESFDISFSNPPFGKDIKIIGKAKLSQYELNDNKSEGNVSTLFLERNLQLLKDGGILAIILPETYFHAPSMKNVRNFIYRHNIKWIIDIPHNTFRPHNNAKCIIIILQKNKPQNEKINMAVAQYIGHDHNGKAIYDENGLINDDTLKILDEISNQIKNGGGEYTFEVNANEVIQRDILIPRYYWKVKEKNLMTEAKKEGIEFIKLTTLIDEEILKFFDGNGSPKAEFKGIGDIPYIRVKDIVNWQIYKDPTALIPQYEYDRLYKADKQLQVNDILFVRRGSYRIGSVAMVSPYDLECILTREILVLRISDENKYGLTPYYLLYALSHKYTYEQELNKIFIDTTLPNIANRWKEISIPIYQDKNKQNEISNRVKTLIKSQWRSLEEIYKLKEQDGVYYT